VGEIKLMSTEYVAAQNKWLKPRSSKSKSIDSDAPTPYTNEVGEALPPSENYHLKVTDVGKDFASIQLFKTHTPEPSEDIVIPGITIRSFFGFSVAVIPRTTIHIDKGQIDAAVLGTFKFWYTGEDTLESPADPANAVVAMGKNWPVNTALKSNGAVQVDFEVEGQTVKNQLELNGSVPFFQKTPYQFRLFTTNFGYLGEENKPFFYETSRESMFAVNKGL